MKFVQKESKYFVQKAVKQLAQGEMEQAEQEIE
jgi:hypothetical protein